MSAVRETVPAALAGQRLDRVVAMLTGVSRSEAAALVDSGEVVVDGTAVTTRAHRLDEGVVVEIEVSLERTDEPIEPDPSVVVPLVYEDADLVVVDKPAGVVVHPGAGQRTGTLAHGLVARYPELAEVGEKDRPGIVHRLDKGTSGLLLVARSSAAYEALVTMLSGRQVERRYRSLVWGDVEESSGVVDAPIGRSARHRTRMSVTMQGKPARTRYEVLQRYDRPIQVTELACRLETGRTHQIRVHLASIGHPVVGDDLYAGARKLAERLDLARPFLHAEHLALAHPLTGDPLAFDSPLPADLSAVRTSLSGRPGRR